MAATCQSVRCTADLTMHVSRNATGNLEEGALRVVHGVDCVTDVLSVSVTDLRPRLNDLELDATIEVVATLEETASMETAARNALTSTFGIQQVESLDTVRPTATDGHPVT